MFIAVINENFDVAEEQKRSRQASHFWAAQRPEKARAPWIRRMNPYRWFEAKPKAIAVDQLPSNLVLPMQKSLVQDYSFALRDRRSGLQVAHLRFSQALSDNLSFRISRADPVARDTYQRSPSMFYGISLTAKSLTMFLWPRFAVTEEIQSYLMMRLMRKRRGICKTFAFAVLSVFTDSP